MGDAGRVGRVEFRAIEKPRTDDEAAAHAVEGGAADHGMRTVGEDVDERTAGLGPTTGDFDARGGRGDGELELVEKIRPPLAKPTGDGERPEAALQEKTVFEGFEVLFERAVREVVADAGPGFGGIEMAAVKGERGAALFHGDVVGVDAAEGDAGGKGFEFPAGTEPRVADGAIQSGEIKIFPDVDPETFAERCKNGGGDRAVEVHRGGLGGKIDLGLKRERGVQNEGRDVGGESGERAGAEADGDGAGGETCGGNRAGGKIDFLRDELEAAGAEGAAHESAHVAGGGVEREGEGVGGELEAGGDRGVAK